jgi:hypothetical protein
VSLKIDLVGAEVTRRKNISETPYVVSYTIKQ